jgi:lantibiotic modifying enzyme
MKKSLGLMRSSDGHISSLFQGGLMKKRAAVSVLIVLIAAACLLIFIKASEKEKKPYLDAALRATQWIRASAVQTEEGTTWPAIPDNEKSIGNILYNGTPGVILFFLEMYYATGDKTFLDDARAGADYMLATLDKERGAGLYVGISGIGFALEETYKATKDEKYLKGVEKCIHYLKENVVKKKTGVEWSTTTDIISGSAGTGLFLIYAAKELKDTSLLDLAAQAGMRLIELGQSDKGGTKWAADTERPLLMPNFSHGTAGISYFLASLYAETEQKEFLDSALSGARYLQSIAQTEGDTCLIFHDELDGKDLYYLGWCHGPTGSAQLFYRLYQVTGDEGWMEWVEKCARAILLSGIPEKQTPGFWNNVGQCCGSAGVAEFFLNLYRIKQKKEYIDFARHLTSDLLKRGTHDESGLKWIHGEYRRRPEFLQAQTGLMQGAAGIGLWLLHLDYFDRSKTPRIVLPDSPY